MDIDVYPGGVDFQTQVDEWTMAVSESFRMYVLDAFLDRSRLHPTVIDENQENCLPPEALCVVCR